MNTASVSHTTTMPVLSTSLGLYLAASWFTVAAAANVVLTPNQIDSLTLYGGTIAAFFTIVYHRGKNPRLGPYSLIFAFFASLVSGYLLPELVVFKLAGDVDLPRKAWLLISLILGLCGTTIITYVLKWLDLRGDKAMDQVFRMSIPKAIQGENQVIEVVQTIEKPKSLGQDGPAGEQ